MVVVSGEVGAGKTTLIRGACRALGIEGPVTSPTFTIGHRYEGGRLPVSHLDLYRLDGLEGEEPALLDDYLDPGSVAFVEWPAVAEPQLAGRRVVRGAPRPRRRRPPRRSSCPPHPPANRRVWRGTVHVASTERRNRERRDA